MIAAECPVSDLSVPQAYDELAMCPLYVLNRSLAVGCLKLHWTVPQLLLHLVVYVKATCTNVVLALLC